MAINKEKIEYFALLAEIIGALGVIISVIYLAVQVGDGNKELRAQNHHDALELAQSPMQMLIENGDLAEIYIKSKKSADLLSEAEEERIATYNFILFNSWEFSYYQNVDNSIPHELWIGHDGWMRGEVEDNPAFERGWREHEHAFAEPFKGYVNALFTAREEKARAR